MSQWYIPQSVSGGGMGVICVAVIQSHDNRSRSRSHYNINCIGLNNNKLTAE